MAFKYKQIRKLVLSDKLLHQLTEGAALHFTRGEMASVLGCSRCTLWSFMRDNPEALEAFERGRLIGRVRLRQVLWNLVQKDARTARFLASDSNWLAMDVGGDRERARKRKHAGTVEPQQNTISAADSIARIVEIQAAVTDGGRLEARRTPADSARAETTETQQT